MADVGRSTVTVIVIRFGSNIQTGNTAVGSVNGKSKLQWAVELIVHCVKHSMACESVNAEANMVGLWATATRRRFIPLGAMPNSTLL